MKIDAGRCPVHHHDDLVEGHRHFPAPDGVPLWDHDHYDVSVLTDPWPYYRELRSQGPFVYSPRYSVLICGRYAEVREVFSDHERFVSSRGVGLSDWEVDEPWRKPSIILEADPPEHTRTRRAMSRALSLKAIKALRPMFREAAQELVTQLLQRESFEAVGELAEIFPTTVFPVAVGMTQRDRRHLVDYGGCVFNALGPDNDLRRDALRKVGGIAPWVEESCRRDRLLAGGIGDAIYQAADAGDLEYEEASLLVRSLLSAGVDTTVTGLGNALWCFANNPDQYSLLADDPFLARQTVDEVVRYTSPVHSFCRTAAVDTQVAGVAIPQSSKIVCVLASANLDPEKWDDPERFDIHRKPVGHLAFGIGIHGCVGQMIARAEMEEVFKVLSEKVEKIELAGLARWRPNNAIHALDELPLRFVGKS